MMTPARILILSLLVTCSCSRQEPSQAGSGAAATSEEQPGSNLTSLIHVADPKITPQLLTGWHGVEQGSWRWTEKQFSVSLKTPAPGKSATMNLRFVLPEALITRLRTITLSAIVNGTALPSESYSKAGEQLYTQSVPASALTGDVARVDFSLDKALPPGDADHRELGVVVSAIGLE